ncbi:MAG: hypothetical protein GTO45_21500 [Candidatus Aminicenantes bacterium]|nr:hypothetical protein [Candidatus Aminicenantes bacterium]NIM81332.1 hypothetical protein [Candidatus Aminicenantes bacterium]NIN20742.1 hypothetical protein [Candidatus Aminicenantes bacterium]NIN44520.1 hypothetical protein [Candidatus Aminicenantes bacterium]NIN87340.1 hypothetical protein [Candidatus Aminicenantes bacterium]
MENPYITKINLTTGSQSITGSTRMQATTSETFVTGIILEHALDNILKRYLTKPEMETLGFRPGISMSKRLLEFIPLQKSVYELKHLISEFIDLEAGTYANNRFSTYFANNALITVFIDSTERSPTFRLFPLDTVKAHKRKSWIQVWTTAKHGQEAWINFLGRSFYGLKSRFYKEPFLNNIEDKYLKAAALSSLKNAGDDQQFLYDFSFSDFNKKNRCPQRDDLGVLVLLDDEIENLNDPKSSFCRFIDYFNRKHANLVCIAVSKNPVKNMELLTKKLKGDNKTNQLLPLVINLENDPLWIRQHIALKMLLNAHSTAVMAKLGKVVGNTMTSVNPGNLKLIGRATYLIRSHVNDVLSQENWIKKYGKIKPVTYNDANAVLFDTVDYLENRDISAGGVGGSISEVDISIIRILEAYRKNGNVSRASVMSTYRKFGLELYLLSLNPSPGKK